MRDEISLKLLRDVPILLSEPGESNAQEFVATLKEASWIKNRKGGLCSPSSLYDPEGKWQRCTIRARSITWLTSGFSPFARCSLIIDAVARGRVLPRLRVLRER